MGLDTSAHPVDVALFRDRLVPFVKDGAPIDDLIARAAQRAFLADRTATWRFAALRFSWEVRRAQEAVVPQVTERSPDPHHKLSFVGRLLGRKQKTMEFTRPERVPGLLGFDSDIASFGRPYFITANGTDNVLAVYDRYLKADNEAAIDAIAREMVTALSAGALNFPAGTRPEVVSATRALLPFEKHILPVRDKNDGPAPTLAQQHKRLKRETELWRVVFQNRDSRDPLPAEYLNPEGDGDDVPTRDYVANLPMQLAGFAAQVMPGWMSRGYGFASSLFEKIGVKASHIFETPEALFKDLVNAAPATRKALATTIPDNFSLGGYVPPQKMQAFVDLVTEHRREMILAFHKGPPPADIDEMAYDHTKILEPATYALRNGYGYLEAAEIYSAPLGWAN
ncbi:MAG: hypothetical protein ACKVRO_02700 [Micropepsaceae bacterium]